MRQGFKQMVTNRFVADSFMRFAMMDYGRVLFRALRPAGFTGAPHETLSSKARNWTLFDVAKLTHPGVQVLPGEAGSKWQSVIAQWIDFIPKYSGLKDGFKTDYAEVHVHASRDMGFENIEKGVKEVLSKNYLLAGDSTYQTYSHEFFDALTSYANIILPVSPRLTCMHFGIARRTTTSSNGKANCTNTPGWSILGRCYRNPRFASKAWRANAFGAAPAGSWCPTIKFAATNCLRRTARSFLRRASPQ